MLANTKEEFVHKDAKVYAFDKVWRSCFLLLQTSYTHQIMFPEVHFHAELIGASPVKIVYKMTKLFEFFEGVS